MVDEGKDKGKIHPRTGHEGPEGEYTYSCTLYFTLALDGLGGQRHALAALPAGKGSTTCCIGGWVGPRANLDGCGKSCPPHPPGFDP